MADIVIRNIDCITGESAESGKDMLRNVTLIIKDGYISIKFWPKKKVRRHSVKN